MPHPTLLETQTQTPFIRQRLTTRLLTPIFLKTMDSQMNSKLLNKILEDGIISLSSGESDVNLLEPDLGLDLEEDLDITKPHSIIDELMDGPPTHYQDSQNYQH